MEKIVEMFQNEALDMKIQRLNANHNIVHGKERGLGSSCFV